MTYPSKRDLGVALIVLPIRLLMLGGGCLLLCLVAAQVVPPSALIPGMLLTVTGGLSVWAFFATSCEITPAHLRVRFGPLRWRIPLGAIAEVASRGGLIPDRAWGLCWSLERVVIKYRKRNGKLAFLGVAVSPQDRAGFLRDLSRAVQGLGSPSDRSGTLPLA